MPYCCKWIDPVRLCCLFCMPVVASLRCYCILPSCPVAAAATDASKHDAQKQPALATSHTQKLPQGLCYVMLCV
jgi:hypothetical protein